MVRTGRWQTLVDLAFTNMSLLYINTENNSFSEILLWIFRTNFQKWSSDFIAQREAQSLLTRTINNIRAGSGLIALGHFILIDFHIYQGVLAESPSGS